MAARRSTMAWQRAVIVLSGTLVGVVVVVCLYLARAICIPVALAIFLAFVLWRQVLAVQEWGIGRTGAVRAVVLLAGLLLGGISWVVGTEISPLLAEVPKYSENAENKIQAFQDWTKENSLSKLLRKFGNTWRGAAVPADDSGELPNPSKIGRASCRER